MGIYTQFLRSFKGKLNKPTKHKPWTEEEHKLLFRLYKEKGSVWSLMMKHFPGRTEAGIKNWFYASLRRVVRKKIRGLTDAKLITKIKQNIKDHVDDALEYGFTQSNKRGRPKGRKNGKRRSKPVDEPNEVESLPFPEALPTDFNSRLCPQESSTEIDKPNHIQLPFPYFYPKHFKGMNKQEESLVKVINMQSSYVDLFLPFQMHSIRELTPKPVITLNKS